MIIIGRASRASKSITPEREIVTIKREIRDIKQFENRLAVSLEEEAHKVIEHLLEKNYGVCVGLERLTLERAEIDIYGNN